MSDRIGIIKCRGGLNEETADLDINQGHVRRSCNYEQVADGGYRRVSGSHIWNGRPYKPQLPRISIVETTQRFNFAEGEQIVYQRAAISYESQSGLTYKVLAVIGRERSNLWIVEKDQATDFFESAEVFDVNYSAIVLAENPTLSTVEQDNINSIITEFAADLPEVPVPGSGDIELVHGHNGQLLVARRVTDSFDVQFSTTSGDGYTSRGTLSIPPNITNRSWSAITYHFSGQNISTFIATGSSQPLRFNGVGNVTTIPVGTLTEFPDHCIVHQNHLFLGYRNGSVIHSDLGDPTSFTSIGGSTEFNVGSPVNGFQVLPGGALAIFCEDEISILSGTSAADWSLAKHSNEVGAIEGTIQNLPTAIFASKRGITTLSASDNYGDFSSNTLSHNYYPTYQRIVRNTKLFTWVSKDKSQYRLINEHGRGLYLTFNNGKLSGAMEVDLKHNVTAVGVIEGDPDQLFFASGGNIHRMDYGNTFSGRAMDAFLQFPFNHYGSPRQKKRFKQAVLDMKGDPRTLLQIKPTLEKGDPYHCEAETVETYSADPRDEYKSNELSRFEQTFQGTVYTAGTGFDQSLLIIAANELEHEIDSITTHYTFRGQKR